jgi:hypothetical protein
MKFEKLLIFGFLLLMLSASWIPSSSALEDFPRKEIVTNKDINLSARPSNQSITCNWMGWKNSYPGAKCRRKGCVTRIEVLSMKCLEGVITEVRTDRVCQTCVEPPTR